MKIGIDISQIVYKGSGVGHFTRSLVETLLQYDEKNKYTFFFSSLRGELDKSLEQNIIAKDHRLIKWKLPPTLLSYLFNDLHSFSRPFTSHLPFLAPLDWFITSDWTEPYLGIKKATIVHDLVFKRYPDTLDSSIVTTQQKRLNWVCQESALIFADSKSSKNDLISYYAIDEKKIVVNYPGVDILSVDEKQIISVKNKFNLIRPFILSVGKLEPRKNIKRLIKAFSQLNHQDIDLVIVGPKGWDQQPTSLAAKRTDIKFLGYVNDLELNCLYKSCLFFIYPSLWEGFGYPVIEAMKHGVPVTTSSTSSLKEITDNCALLFDPFNTEEIYHCIDTLIQNSKLRSELAAKGKKQAEKFSWKNYINTMLDSLSRIS